MTQITDYRISRIRQLRDLTADDEAKMSAADNAVCTREATIDRLYTMLEMLKEDKLAETTGTVTTYEHHLR
jgi:hypothetical protein